MKLPKKKIKTTRLDKILDQHNYNVIDFMNLDIEGHELEVIETINFKKTSIKYICIEMINHNEMSVQNSKKIKSLLEVNNFFLIKKFDFNHIFENKEFK